jgi:polar amino acid transport system substrate-binding protein
MKRFLAAIAVIALITVLPLQSPAQGAAPIKAPPGLKTSGVLTVGTNIPYPPMESYTGANQDVPTGADIDIAKALAGKMGLRADFVDIPNFDTIIPALQAKRFDIIMSSMGITPDRAKVLNFIPYFVAGESIVVVKGNPKHILKIGDLSGLTAGVQASTTESDSLAAENKVLKAAHKPLISIQSYKQDSDALQQLILGRINAYLTDFPVAAYYVSKRSSQLQFGGQQFATQTYGIAVRKSDPALLNALKKALVLVRKDGEYTKILKSYGLQQGALK